MPIYEYRCNDCGHEFETIQKISESPLETCPSCEEDALVKKISVAGFRLSGTGWYETDFKSGNKRNLAGAERSETGDSAGDSGAKDSNGKSSDQGSGDKQAAEASSGSDSSSKAASSSGSDSGSSKSSGAAKSSKTDSAS